MKAILLPISGFIILFFTTSLRGQVENNGGGKKLGKIRSVISTNAKEIEKPNSIKIDGANGFKKAYEREQKKVKKQQQEQKFNNKGIISQAKLTEERFLKSFKKINGI